MAKQRLKLPMKFEEAVADLLKVKLPEKGEPKKADADIEETKQEAVTSNHV